MTKLTDLVKELHKKISSIEKTTTYPTCMTTEPQQTYYVFFKKGQMSMASTVIRLVNKIYKTNYPTEVNK